MSYDYYGPGYQPPQVYYPQVAPPQYVPPPRRRSDRRFWAFLIIAGIILVAVGVVVIHALSPRWDPGPRVQTTQSYQLGYNEIGPKAVLVFGDAGSCDAYARSYLVHLGSVPSWWDQDAVILGCVDYGDAHPHQGLGG